MRVKTHLTGTVLHEAGEVKLVRRGGMYFTVEMDASVQPQTNHGGRKTGGWVVLVKDPHATNGYLDAYPSNLPQALRDIVKLRQRRDFNASRAETK